jgi:hypothetical protein
MTIMSGHSAVAPAVSRRTYTVTAHIVVGCDADLRDPFIRVAVFRALVDQLTGAPLVVDTPYGVATAEIGLVTTVS